MNLTCMWLVRVSPTYDRWRVELVEALGRTSDFVYACASDRRDRMHSFTWCKGKDLVRALRNAEFAAAVDRADRARPLHWNTKRTDW